LASADGAALPPDLPGQFLTVKVRAQGDASPLIRSYSLSGAPGTGTYRISVKVEPSLGFPKKIERILRDPNVAIAYHTRDHGFATSDSYVLAQGAASVDLRPSPERLAELMRASEPFLGEVRRGPLWDWLLREYHQERVFVDIALKRVTAWACRSGIRGLPQPASAPARAAAVR
jgi:hypothetical protein